MKTINIYGLDLKLNESLVINNLYVLKVIKVIPENEAIKTAIYNKITKEGINRKEIYGYKDIDKYLKELIEENKIECRMENHSRRLKITYHKIKS